MELHTDAVNGLFDLCLLCIQQYAMLVLVRFPFPMNQKSKSGALI